MNPTQVPETSASAGDEKLSQLIAALRQAERIAADICDSTKNAGMHYSTKVDSQVLGAMVRHYVASREDGLR